MMGNDTTPYRVRLGDRIELQKPAVFGKESRLIEMPISWSLDDSPHFGFVRTQSSVLPGLKNAGAVVANWIDDFLYMKRETDWGILTYTFHPFVIGRGHRMMALERLIERLAAGGAEFMRMETAAELFDKRAPYKLIPASTTGRRIGRGARPRSTRGGASSVSNILLPQKSEPERSPL